MKNTSTPWTYKIPLEVLNLGLVFLKEWVCGDINCSVLPIYGAATAHAGEQMLNNVIRSCHGGEDLAMNIRSRSNFISTPQSW